MTIEQALADLATATSAEHLGRQHMLAGVPVVCVKREMTAEEASAFAGGRFAADGLAVEGIRVTVDSGLLTHIPVVGGQLNVDGFDYDIKTVTKTGNMVRISCLRYLS